MSLVDDAKAKLEEAKNKAEELKDDVSEKADILKQRLEGEADKANGHEFKGVAKIKASEIRDKLN